MAKCDAMLLLGSHIHIAGNTNGGFTSFLAVLPTADHLIPFNLAKVLAEQVDVGMCPALDHMGGSDNI